ncbi:MAG TPA: phage tail protein [Dehalococcoidia bacterium]|nr:phage tail protein [Dehalococcoidia bacterium]
MNGGVNPYPIEESSYLAYLPAIYRQDPFMGRFLRVFEEVLTPVQAMVNTLPERFDPDVTTAIMLDFLATWVGARRPPNLPEERWRKAVKLSVWLYRWRGTRRGLAVALELLVGRRPLIAENTDGLALGSDSSLGQNTALDNIVPQHFTVTFDCAADEIDTGLAHDIIQAYKPGPASYDILFRPAVRT